METSCGGKQMRRFLPLGSVISCKSNCSLPPRSFWDSGSVPLLAFLRNVWFPWIRINREHLTDGRVHCHCSASSLNSDFDSSSTQYSVKNPSPGHRQLSQNSCTLLFPCQFCHFHHDPKNFRRYNRLPCPAKYLNGVSFILLLSPIFDRVLLCTTKLKKLGVKRNCVLWWVFREYFLGSNKGLSSLCNLPSVGKGMLVPTHLPICPFLWNL